MANRARMYEFSKCYAGNRSPYDKDNLLQPHYVFARSKDRALRQLEQAGIYISGDRLKLVRRSRQTPEQALIRAIYEPSRKYAEHCARAAALRRELS